MIKVSPSFDQNHFPRHMADDAGHYPMDEVNRQRIAEDAHRYRENMERQAELGDKYEMDERAREPMRVYRINPSARIYKHALHLTKDARLFHVLQGEVTVYCTLCDTVVRYGWMAPCWNANAAQTEHACGQSGMRMIESLPEPGMTHAVFCRVCEKTVSIVDLFSETDDEYAAKEIQLCDHSNHTVKSAIKQ